MLQLKILIFFLLELLLIVSDILNFVAKLGSALSYTKSAVFTVYIYTALDEPELSCSFSECTANMKIVKSICSSWDYIVIYVQSCIFICYLI